METHTCYNKEKVKMGLWSRDEDEKLRKYISAHGRGCWSLVPTLAGLQMCGKSCRLRWINYLRPGLKRGDFTPDEIATLIELHKVVGNRWAQIAKYLPGRTENEIKNYWNAHIKKNLQNFGSRNSSSSNHLQLLNPNNDSIPNAPPGFAPFESQMMNYTTNLAPMAPPSCPNISCNFQTTVRNVQPQISEQNDDFMFFFDNSHSNSNPLMPNIGATEKAKGVAFETPPSFTSPAGFVIPNDGFLVFGNERRHVSIPMISATLNPSFNPLHRSLIPRLPHHAPGLFS